MGDMKRKVTVRFFTSLREKTQKREEVVELSGDITMMELLKRLSERYDRQFADYLYDKQGKIRSHFQLLVNGRNIATLQGLQTKLRAGDEVAIVPPVGGG